ncbi:MAG: hypothetical protein K2I93_03820 [Oscillospiraceae bacterium]|nr:hypothetical protein [Oscillospiraceae bacterium]
MSHEALWQTFEDSGNIADYLAYAAIKGLEHGDSERRGAGTESTAGTGQVH